MNANELMIGDWVLTLDSTHEEKVQAQIWAIEEGQTSILVKRDITNWFVDIEWIEPIPLTPEILGKNFREYLPGINLMYQLKGPYFAMNEEGNQWVFGLVKEDGEKSCRYPLVKITYVHQLQHALRLCRIEKEIEL